MSRVRFTVHTATSVIHWVIKLSEDFNADRAQAELDHALRQNRSIRLGTPDCVPIVILNPANIVAICVTEEN